MIRCIFLTIIFLLISLACLGNQSDFLKALNQVEASGRSGPILGDNGRALGPFQIHKSYWIDSGVKGSYSQCESYSYSCKVVIAYLNRYCPIALKHEQWETCARVHNGGPRGYMREQTKKYWIKVKKELTKNSV